MTQRNRFLFFPTSPGALSGSGEATDRYPEFSRELIFKLCTLSFSPLENCRGRAGLYSPTGTEMSLTGARPASPASASRAPGSPAARLRRTGGASGAIETRGPRAARAPRRRPRLWTIPATPGPGRGPRAAPAGSGEKKPRTWRAEPEFRVFSLGWEINKFTKSPNKEKLTDSSSGNRGKSDPGIQANGGFCFVSCF